MAEIHLFQGDCLQVLPSLPENSIDAIVTDPPYGLGAQPDMAEVLQHWLKDGDFRNKGSGFMGNTWDAFVPGPAVWRECLRVLKPGGHLLSFFGTRTHDVGTLAIRLAGFEIRDTIMWVYGSGLSKSMNISKAIRKACDQGKIDTRTGEEAALRWDGWGTCLKPALEPITVARKPLDGTVVNNVLTHGTGGINIDDCRVEPTGESRRRVGEASQERRYDDRGATNFARTPGVRGGDPRGRLPANLIHDGSEEVLGFFPQAPGQLARASSDPASPRTRKVYGKYERADDPMVPRGDTGSAARFFYCAKATSKERNLGLPEGHQNKHPTVKPLALMRHLCRLVVPRDGVVLDPFLGSGTTGLAAKAEGFSFVGIEKEEEYWEMARKRLGV